jgi:hypothetical protein
MAYNAEQRPTPSRDELRARIPGWGADLDPNDRPSVPKLKYDPAATGAHWDLPEPQPSKWPRERSIEHKLLTPVFGTATPARGLSGAIRRFSYKKYSEARAAHWLLLLAADRIDAGGNHLRSYLTARPDNPITETGIHSEFTHHGLASRMGRKRADLSHVWMDPWIVAGPWILTGGIGVFALKAVLARRSQKRSTGDQGYPPVSGAKPTVRRGWLGRRAGQICGCVVRPRAGMPPTG